MQSPVARRVGDDFDRVRAQGAGMGFPAQKRQWDQASQKHHGFRRANHGRRKTHALVLRIGIRPPPGILSISKSRSGVSHCSPSSLQLKPL